MERVDPYCGGVTLHFIVLSSDFEEISKYMAQKIFFFHHLTEYCPRVLSF